MAQTSPLGPAWWRAQALADAGDLAGARAVLERAVELGKANLSEDDPDVLRTSYQLAGIHRRLGEPAVARRVLEEAYAAGRWRLGDADPLMVEISHDIGVVAEELGNRHEARKAFGRVVEFGPAVLGAQHRVVTRARAYLGNDQTPSVRPEAASQTPAAPPAVPDQRAGQPEVTPAAAEENTTVFPVVERVTDVFEAVPRPLGSGPAQPHTSASRPVWAGGGDGLRSAMDEDTAAQPVVVPRFGRDAPPVGVPGQRRPALADPGGLAAPLVVTTPYRRIWPELAPYEKRGLGLFAAIAAVLAAVVAVAALVFVLANRGDDPPGDPNVPTLGGAEPTLVRLQDEGSKISITWQDPSAGTVSFMVAMGHPGEQLKPVATLGPGQTSYDLGALNASLDYCFTVIAVYSADQFATSAQTCTDRPAPSTSK